MSATPPPGTMPSSTAARVAESASSTRCFFSFSSVSVAAPTLMTATPPASFASRSCSFSRSKSLVVVFDLRADLLDAALDRVLVAARPRRSWCRPWWRRRGGRGRGPATVTLSSLRPISSEITWPPVRMAMSRSMSLRRSPKPGALTARHVERAAQLVDDQRRQRLAVDVLGDDDEVLGDLEDLLQHRQDVLRRRRSSCR